MALIPYPPQQPSEGHGGCTIAISKHMKTTGYGKVYQLKHKDLGVNSKEIQRIGQKRIKYTECRSRHEIRTVSRKSGTIGGD